MKRWAGVLALLLLPLGGCRADLLPYAREIEDMSLVRTLGVDADADGGGGHRRHRRAGDGRPRP